MIVAGEYLGLTGARLDGADLLSCGLATHFVPSQVTLKKSVLFNNLRMPLFL